MIRMASWQPAIWPGVLLVVASFSFQLSLAQAPAAGTVAMTGARVIDGTGRAPIETATIVITDGRIAAVGPAAAVSIPPARPAWTCPARPSFPGWSTPTGT